MLSRELIDSISLRYPCRTSQLEQLRVLIGSVWPPFPLSPRPHHNFLANNSKDSFPSPQAFIIHGLESTGKTTVTRTLLEEAGHSFTWVSCNECITPRQLTERIASTITAELVPEDTNFPRCENVNALSVYLQQLLKDAERKHFLVLDRIDQQRDAPPTLMASLRRIGELVRHSTSYTGCN